MRRQSCQANRRDPIRQALRPDIRHESRQGASNRSSNQQNLTRFISPEKIIPRPRRKQSQEIRNRHLQIHHARNLAIGQARKPTAPPQPSRVPGIKCHPEEEEGGEAGDPAEGSTDGEKHAQVPFVGGGGGGDVVVADGDEGAVVEEGDEHEHQDGHVEEGGPVLGCSLGLEFNGVEGKDSDEEEDQQLQRGGDTIGDKGCHAPEDNTGDDDGRDDGGEAGLGQHDISSSTGSIRGALHGNAHVGALEGGSVVDTVAGHARLWERRRGREGGRGGKVGAYVLLWGHHFARL